MLAAYPDGVTRLRLSSSWRLGPLTTALIQPAFYADLPLTSARPPRHIQLNGAALPELTTRLVTPLAGPSDPIVASTAADRVRELLSTGFVVDDHRSAQPLEPHAIAVIAPHVEQASAVAARLADVPGVLIATANQAQGLDREAVVVIHPLAGYREAPAFAIDPGRLCVALSRHRSHATIVVDTSTDAVLRHAQADAPNDSALAIQDSVLRELRTTS